MNIKTGQLSNLFGYATDRFGTGGTVCADYWHATTQLVFASQLSHTTPIYTVFVCRSRARLQKVIVSLQLRSSDPGRVVYV